jgi:hypothetical protein
MTAFTFRMPAGIPGDVNRAEIATIEPQVITPAGNANAPVAFGVGVLPDAATGQIRLPATGDTAIYGFLVRPYPIQDSLQAPVLGVSTAEAQGACDVLRRGYMTVLLQNATAAVKGAPVYVRISGFTGLLLQGGVEAAAGSGLIAANAVFTGPADANGITEIAFNI